MSILLDMRLREAARRAAKRLRGFDDPEFHTGSEISFYYQFRRVLALPSMRIPQRGLISYAEAVVVSRLDDAGAGRKDDLIDELAELLQGPAVNDAGDRVPVELPAVREDLREMLRVPAMRFYFRSQDGAAFADGVRGLAIRIGRPLRIGLDPIEEEPVEQFRVTGLGGTVSCWISYDMLRLVTESVPITAYQAEEYVTAV